MAQPHFIETFFSFEISRIEFFYQSAYHPAAITEQQEEKKTHTFWHKTRFSLTLMKFTVDFGFQLMSFNLKSEFQNNSKENEIRQLLLHTAHRSS